MDTQDAMIVHQNRAEMSVRALDGMKDQAKQLILSGYMPDKFKKPEQVVVTMLYGRELGMSPMEAVKEIHVINGVPGVSTNFMNRRVRERLPNATVDVLEKNDKRCRISFQRSPRHKPVEVSYTIEEAKAAELTGKSVWKKHPTDMLFNRCFSRMVREECPEVVSGFVHTPEELEEIPDNRDPATPVRTGEAPAAKADVKTVEAEIVQAAPANDAIDEDAAMDFIAAITDMTEEAEIEKAHREFADHWSKKSPATAAEGYGEYKKRLQRLRDAKAGRTS